MSVTFALHGCMLSSFQLSFSRNWHQIDGGNDYISCGLFGWKHQHFLVPWFFCCVPVTFVSVNPALSAPAVFWITSVQGRIMFLHVSNCPHLYNCVCSWTGLYDNWSTNHWASKHHRLTIIKGCKRHLLHVNITVPCLNWDQDRHTDQNLLMLIIVVCCPTCWRNGFDLWFHRMKLALRALLRQDGFKQTAALTLLSDEVLCYFILKTNFILSADPSSAQNSQQIKPGSARDYPTLVFPWEDPFIFFRPFGSSNSAEQWCPLLHPWKPCSSRRYCGSLRYGFLPQLFCGTTVLNEQGKDLPIRR